MGSYHQSGKWQNLFLRVDLDANIYALLAIIRVDKPMAFLKIMIGACINRASKILCLVLMINFCSASNFLIGNRFGSLVVLLLMWCGCILGQNISLKVGNAVKC